MATTLRDQHDDLQYALDFYAAVDGALQEEITAVRRQERRDAIAVHDGRRVTGDASDDASGDDSGEVSGEDSGDGVRYVFRSATRAPVRTGERVRCATAGAPPLRAVVARVGPGELTLDLEQDVGPVVPAAMVERDAAWLQEALRRRLATVAAALSRGEDTAPYDPDSAFAAFQPDAATPDDFAPLTLPEATFTAPDGIAFNDEQAEAVRRVLAQPTTFIWGPPGTGKTAVLAKAVADLAHQGQHVLVVTPSNTAADVLLTALYPWMAQHPLIGRGVVQRRGAHVTDQLSQALREVFVPERILRRLRDESDTVRAFLEEERASVAIGRVEDTAVHDAELASLTAERDGLARAMERHCLVTVTPIANAYLLPELWRAFDAVVVDEASMIGVPSLVAVAGLSRSRLVIAGDWQQLGPVTAGNTPAVRRWLGRDVFRAAGVPASVAAECETSWVVMLRDQYRMPGAVAALVADDWYLGRLRTAHRRAPVIRLPFGDGPVVLVDTSGLEPTVSRGSRANTVHAEVVADIVAAVRRTNRTSSARIGVFTLYREQVDCLRAAQRAPGCLAGDVTATVHRAQGAEAEVAVLDLADGPGAAPTFLRAASCDADGARLLNVAVTRARDALVVVANVPFLERTGGAVVRRLLQRLREEGDVVDARTIMRTATR